MAVFMNTNKLKKAEGANLAVYEVIHPLADVQEQKRSPESLGRLRMSASVRLSLMVLRGYLLLIGLLVAYHVLTLARHGIH